MYHRPFKKRAVLSLFLFIIILPVAADAQKEVTAESLTDLTEGRTLIRAIRELETIASPYLFEDFRSGYVTLENKVNSETLMMNYNIHKERVEFIQGSFALSIKSGRLSGFEFTDEETRYLFRNGYEARRLTPDDFVRVLAEGPVTALLKYDVSFQQDVPTYGVATQQDRYTRSYRLFLKNNGEIERIRRLNERSILRAVDPFRDEMHSYIRQEQLDLSSSDDLQRFFQYYNTLFDE